MKANDCTERLGCEKRLVTASTVSDNGSTPFQDTAPATMPDGKLCDFLWTTSPQPHAVRRRAILKKYPEIERLYGTDPR